MIFPKNKIWGIRLKSRWLRAVKNHSKASKIHSSGDMRPEHKKRKVRKTDALVNFAANFITKRKESMGKCSCTVKKQATENKR